MVTILWATAPLDFMSGNKVVTGLPETASYRELATPAIFDVMTPVVPTFAKPCKTRLHRLLIRKPRFESLSRKPLRPMWGTLMVPTVYQNSPLHLQMRPQAPSPHRTTLMLPVDPHSVDGFAPSEDDASPA